MEELEALKGKVRALERAADRGEITARLQEINGLLLTGYVLKLGTAELEPLRVEAYYYKPGVFEDRFMHRAGGVYGPRQRGRFGRLYIHPGYGGADLVLSLGEEYAYSCLIKNARISVGGRVTEPFVKQRRTAAFLKELGVPRDGEDMVLCRRSEEKAGPVFYTVRKGLFGIRERKDFPKEEQDQYNRLPLAAFMELDQRGYDFETGYGRSWAKAEYRARTGQEPF